MTDFRFSGGRKTNGPLIHALDVCHDVQVEPHLQTLTGEVLNSGANSSNEARLDVSVRGFWRRRQSAFYDVRVFNLTYCFLTTSFLQRILIRQLRMLQTKNTREMNYNNDLKCGRPK